MILILAFPLSKRRGIWGIVSAILNVFVFGFIKLLRYYFFREVNYARLFKITFFIPKAPDQN